MNILPYISFMMIIIALLFAAQFKGGSTLKWTQSSHSGFVRCMRAARNNFELKKVPSKDRKAEAKEQGETRDVEFVYFREKKLSEPTKFDISALLKEDDKFLDQVLETLIENLYSHTTFYQEEKNFNTRFVMELKRRKKELLSGDVTLQSLSFKDPALKAAYYKMLKGTYKGERGYPPLCDYITLDLSRKASVYFQAASKPVLQAFLGDEAMQMVEEAELAKYEKGSGKSYALTGKELSELLKENHSQAVIKKITITAPAKKGYKKPFVDEKSGVCLRIPEKKEKSK